MQTEDLYVQCQKEIAPLLTAIQHNDLLGMSRQVETLKGYLARRDPRIGDSTLRQEQLDAIAGLTEAIDRSLETMHLSAREEMLRIRSAEPLLRHLARPTPSAASAAGYIM